MTVPNRAVCSYCQSLARYYLSPDQAVGKLADGRYLLPSPYACRRHLSELVELATLYLLGEDAYRANEQTVDVAVSVLPGFVQDRS